MNSLEILFAKAILQEHVRERMCPKSSLEKELLEKHISKCPLCEEWNEVFGDIVEPLPKIENPPYRPGQIWQISPELEGWVGDADKYFNAPLVAILDIDGRIARVALVCDENLFNLEGIECDGFYIETWNTFSIPLKYLSTYIADVKIPLKETSNIPPCQNPIQEAFIKTELEVSAYFALRVMDEVMEFSGLKNVLDIIEQEEETFLFLVKGEKSEKSILDLLATIPPPESMLPLAASSKEDNMAEPILINFVEFKNNKPYVGARVGYITYREKKGDKLVVGGFVNNPLSSDAGIYAVLVDKITDKIIIPAEEAEIDHKGGFFRLVFSPFSEEMEKKSKISILIGTR